MLSALPRPEADPTYTLDSAPLGGASVKRLILHDVWPRRPGNVGKPHDSVLACSIKVDAKEIGIAELKVIDGNSSCIVTSISSSKLEIGSRRFQFSSLLQFSFYPFVFTPRTKRNSRFLELERKRLTINSFLLNVNLYYNML